MSDSQVFVVTHSSVAGPYPDLATAREKIHPGTQLLPHAFAIVPKGGNKDLIIEATRSDIPAVHP